jgi:hypothetical protein
METEEEKQQLLLIIRQIRLDHPQMSSRLLYEKIKPQTMGRDRFEQFCHINGYKVAVKRSFIKTTNSRNVNCFPNLILELKELTGINQLWVSDITYYRINGEFFYLTFIMDIYNREIVGYNASKTLRTMDTTIPSLLGGIRRRKLPDESGLIFHSDCGGQYYCKEFLRLTTKKGILNSMSKSVYENPFAERINGTIKNDYLKNYAPENYEQLTKLLTKAVTLYNEDRPHKSLNGYSPKGFLEAIEKKLLTKSWIINKKKKVSKKEKTYIYFN